MGGGEAADSPQKTSISTSSSIDTLLGLLRIRVKRGINLAVRDVRSSDPYVVVRMGKQKLKTRVINKDINPEWNEDLTLSVSDPNHPVSLVSTVHYFFTHTIHLSINFIPTINNKMTDCMQTVFDHDTFSPDDPMGDAEFRITQFLEAVSMQLDGVPDGTIITKVQPCRANCLAEESCIVWTDGQVLQDMCLRLKNVECGELEIQLQWIQLPGSKSA